MIYPKLSDGTIDWCVMCKHEGSIFYDLCCECEYPENSDDPPTKYEPKPMTHADNLRAMTDEELAEWIVSITEDDTEGWLDWLRQEAQP